MLSEGIRLYESVLTYLYLVFICLHLAAPVSYHAVGYKFRFFLKTSTPCIAQPHIYYILYVVRIRLVI